MITFCIGFLLFAFYAVLGAAVLAMLYRQQRESAPPLFVLWLSPALGMALTALCVSLASFHGLTVRSAAPWMLTGLGLGAPAVLLWLRPRWPLGRWWTAGAMVLLAWQFAYWPAWLWDLNWSGYFNGDMAHFCMEASRLLDGPFWLQPDVEALSGFDLAQRKAFHHTLGNDRFASEALLAFVSVISGRQPLSIYMAVLLAAYGVQITSLMALVARRDDLHRRALLAAGLLAVAPLNLFGLYCQLLPQFGGVALLLASFTVLTAAPESLGWRRAVALQVLLFSAFAILYPEVSPYAVLGYAVYLIRRWQMARRAIWSDLRPLAFSLPGVALLLNKALLLMVVFMAFRRLPGGLTTVKELIFPHFLLPSGISVFVGFQPISLYLPEPWQTWAIGSAAGLLVLFLGWLFWRAWRTAEPALILCLTMLGMGIGFVVQGNDFGSFKSAMFVQPALAASLAILLTQARTRFWLALLAVVFVFNVRQSLFYARATYNETAAAYGDTRNVSRFGAVLPSLPGSHAYYVDSPSIVFEDALFPQLKGHYAYNANRAYFNESIIPSVGSPVAAALFKFVWPSSDYMEEANRRADVVARSTVRHFHTLGTDFELTRHPRISHFEDFVVVTPRPESRQFNQLHDGPPGNDSVFATVPYRELHDYLVFVHSARGALYYTRHRFDAAYYQPQADIYFPDGKFYRVGSYLLFEVINPTPGARLRVSLTRSLHPATAKSLEGFATVRGREAVPLATCGAGSLNLFSAPVDPIEIDGQFFIALEFHAAPTKFQQPKRGLQALYREDLPVDSISSVAFVRDISLVSEAQYRSLARPTLLTRFPADLAQPGLEYSGLFEDGWISPEARVVLQRDPSARTFVLTLMVPPGVAHAGQPADVEIRLGDGPSSHHPLQSGVNEIVVPLPDAPAAGPLTCQLSFNEHILLPSPDDRPVAGQLSIIGLR